MFEHLTRNELDTLGATLFRGVIRAGKLAQFVASDARLFDRAYEVQHECADVHYDVCMTHARWAA